MATVEVDAAASATSTYHLHRLPSNAEILPGSKISIDDLASAGAPTLDLSVFAVNGNLAQADDDDALNDGIDAAAAGDSDMVKERADWGREFWDHVASEAADPGGKLDIKATLKDAAVNVGGTITSVVFYRLGT